MNISEKGGNPLQIYKDKKIIVLFLAPSLIIIGLFLYYPFAMSFYKSFFNWDGFLTSKFIGLGNYRRLFSDVMIHKAIINTLTLMILVIIFQVGTALLLAVVLDSIKAGAKFFRVVYFLPIVISATAIGLMFKLIYMYDGGLLNGIRALMGLEPIVWITEKTALLAVAVPTIWHYVGFYFVILITAINRIPLDLYESAYLDGITGVSKTIYITIPLIWDIIKVCLVLAITGTLKVFDLPYVITQGGPFGASEFLGTYMNTKTFTDQVFGYGATIAVLIVVLGVVISSIVNKLLKSEEITF